MAKSSSFNEQLFKEAVSKYQLGDWAASLAILEELHAGFPDHKDVAILLEDVKNRIAHDQQDRAHRFAQARERLFRTLGFAVGVLVLLGIFVYAGYWIITRTEANAREQAATENAAVAAGYFFRARTLLDQDRPVEAIQYLDSLGALDPDHPGLKSIRVEAEQQEQLAIVYDSAMDELAAENYAGALVHIEFINDTDPGFRDVAELADRVRRLSVYGDLGEAGQYLIEAEAILSQGLGDRTNLQLAQANLDSASRLGPDSDIFRNRLEILHSFLDSLNDFLDGNPIKSLSSLQFIIEQEPNLFDGMAALMLQEAYLAQAVAGISEGHNTEALGSLLLADELTESQPEAPLYALLVKIKLASTIGDLGQYQDAASRFAALIGDYDLARFYPQGSNPRRTLDAAVSAYREEDYRTAFLRYRVAAERIFSLLPQNDVAIVSGTSLLNMALLNACPQEVLVDLSNLDASEIYPEIDRLLVPFLLD
jgi:tetratricopeptide (TPR) repeat protein